MNSSGARILIVDDEPPILRVLSSNLRSHGFQVIAAATGEEALDRHSSFRPDVVILDLLLPDMHGREVIRTIRQSSSTPIIVLSAHGEEGEKVAALELGADDYLTKPFGVRELLARVRAVMRRSAGLSAGSPVIKLGNLTLDLERRRVCVLGAEVHLTPIEYELLKVLAVHEGKVLTDKMLLEAVWGGQYGADPHYLHVYASRLRKKLGAASHYLITEPGVGYRLLVDDLGK